MTEAGASMGNTDPRSRLEALEAILDELRARGPDLAVVVEGDRDVRALQALGIPEPILKVNIGESLLNLSEAAARQYKGFVILTDWDRKGRELAGRLAEYLGSAGASVDLDLRRRLKRCLPYTIHEVESLQAHVTRLREKVARHQSVEGIRPVP